jgi:hypothetical protein
MLTTTIVGTMYMLGFDRWFATSPPNFLEELEARFADHRLSSMRLIDLLERQFERDGIAATALLKKLRNLIEQARPQINLAVTHVAGSA